ncbi:MAG: hypothetical protein ACRDWI_07920 [Jiangellaceae bacterium]
MCNESIDPGTLDDAWVPQACTLPAVERPLRVAEFHQLFADALRGVDRPATTRLKLRLDRSAEAWARELTARETDCCSFFDFTFTPAEEEQIAVDVNVSAAQVPVLDALAARAHAVLVSP